MNLPISPAERERFAQNLAAYLPPEISHHGQIGPAVARLLQSLDDLASPEICATRGERFGLDPDLLRERVILRENGKVALAGARFRKLDPHFPFVHLSLNFVPSPGEFRRMEQEIGAAFSALAPKGITLRSAARLHLREHQEQWSHSVFGEIPSHLISLPAGLEARWERQTDFYPSYLAEYQSLLAENPRLQPFLRFEKEPDLRAAAERGLLLSVYDHEGWAGVVAGEAREFYGFPSLYIFEIFLSRRWRGRRAAKPLELAFLAPLAPRFSHVFGHIDDSNQSSLKTAESVGRRIVETEYFFPF